MTRLVTPALAACLVLTYLVTCTAGDDWQAHNATARGQGELVFARAFPNLTFSKPLALLQAPEDDSRWFVVEQSGRVLVFENKSGVRRSSVFIDLRAKVDDGPNEAGLLGMAFHPRFQENRRVFLSYTGPGTPLLSYISEFTTSADNGSLTPSSERVIFTLRQPFGNHNGGNIAFGPDGYLYIGFGDGGSAGDPYGNAQNTNTLLGSLLRIDVDRKTPYAIPLDNPFADGGGRPEIYAWGLRNPWRWSFDRATGELWAADVGQDKWEEIDRIRRAGNYGWNVREASHCYQAAQCDTTGLVDPVAEYSHALGCSVTGGYVYRGRHLPKLQGTYVFGDYCSGRIWGLSVDDKRQATTRRLVSTSINISSFGEGNDGELYVLDHRGGGIYRLGPPSSSM
jgi:glucose/arabinose dehydrogenase